MNLQPDTLPAPAPTSSPGMPAPSIALAVPDALQDIFALLKARTGHDFRQYKQATLLRRLERHMQARGVRDLGRYRRLLEDEPEEAQSLLQDLLIGVTSFFRDRDAFAMLEHMLVPQLFHGKGPGDEVRAWVAACSTGEEAYSLAMLLKERVLALPDAPKIQLFASDIDERAIHAARTGLYPASIADGVAPALLERYFTQDGEHYKVCASLRDAVLFAHHNLLHDPAFSRLDMITCRNFLIYLNRDAHLQVLETFHFALKPGGYLFLGSAESADVAAHLFAPVDARHRLYQARPVQHTARRVPHAAAFGPLPRLAPFQPVPGLARPAGRPASHAEIHRRGALKLAPPSVLVNGDAELLHIAGDAGRYLHHGGGEPTCDIVELVAPELRPELRAALFHAKRAGHAIATAPVRHGAPDSQRTLAITVQPLADALGDARGDDEASGQGLLLVSFHEAETLEPAAAPPCADGDSDAVRRLQEELRQLRGKLQRTVEQASLAGAESAAAKDWLRATVGELRMALEEQRTGMEELQSVNEELMTVNAQLRFKVDESAKAHDDLSNLIASTDIATIFLDRDLRIKRYTPRISEVFNVIPGDVGRPLAHLASRLEYPRLLEDAAGVLASLRPIEQEVRSRDGRYYIVRVHPYRTTDNRIDGAVMTFFDITQRRAAEQARRQSDEVARTRLRESEQRFRALVADFAQATWETDAQGRIVMDSPSWRAYTGQNAEEWLDQRWLEAIHPDDRGQLAQGWREAVAHGHALSAEVRLRCAAGDYRWTNVRAAPLRNADGSIRKWVGLNVDVTARKETETALRQSTETMRTMLPQPMLPQAPDGDESA
jgi:two-component system CheB/CheR fusion protein